jgi:hypothetical protein
MELWLTAGERTASMDPAVVRAIAETEIQGIPLRVEEAIARETNLSCDVAVCGVDNNPARVAASRYFRMKGIPVIFTAVIRAASRC